LGAFERGSVKKQIWLNRGGLTIGVVVGVGWLSKFPASPDKKIRLQVVETAWLRVALSVKRENVPAVESLSLE